MGVWGFEVRFSILLLARNIYSVVEVCTLLIALQFVAVLFHLTMEDGRHLDHIFCCSLPLLKQAGSCYYVGCICSGKCNVTVWHLSVCRSHRHTHHDSPGGSM